MHNTFLFYCVYFLDNGSARTRVSQGGTQGITETNLRSSSENSGFAPRRDGFVNGKIPGCYASDWHNRVEEASLENLFH